MLKSLLAAVIVCAGSLAAAPIDGKWISEREVGAADGKTYTHTTVFTLKSEGDALHGTITQTSAAPWMAETNGRAQEISDGRVDGDKFSFKIKIENKNGERTVVYEGTIDGDRLKGVAKFRGIGQSWPFEAKRAD